jgi:Predicted protease with the C-terminal PDZ domain
MTLKYSLTPKDLHAHLFSVQLTIDNPNPLGQVFSLPNWIPGSYLIRDFSKNIISVSANSCGEEVLIKKLDKTIGLPILAKIQLHWNMKSMHLICQFDRPI